MKKIVSFFCALAVIVGTFVIPAATVSATEASDTAAALIPSAYWNNAKTISEATDTEPAVYGKDDNQFTVGGMVFDYEIKAGYTYYLEFDYCGTKDFDTFYPYVTVTHASNAFRETKPDNSSVKLNLPAKATNDWKKVSQIISGDALLSCNLEPSGKYLEIGWHFTGGRVMFKNMKITEYDFSTAETQIPTTTKAVEMSIEDGVNVYSKVADWDPGIGGMVFNYKIESGKKYFLSFDYNAPGDEKFYGWAPQASTVKSMGVYEEHNGAANAVKLLLPEAATNGWVTLAQVLDGDALLSGGAAGYLEIDWGWLNTTVQFKNIKVTELAADVLYPTATVKFDAPYIEDGSVCYKTVGTTNDYYANGGDNSLVFDYKIEKEYNYLLSYDYKYIYDDACGSTPISAYVSMSSTKPFIGGVKDQAFKLNTSTNGWWNNWASDSTVLSGQALTDLNKGEYLTIISTFIKPYALRNIRIVKFKASSDVIYPSGTTGYNAPYNDEDGSVCYKTLCSSDPWESKYAEHGLVFDYKIEKGYNYLLSYDYKFETNGWSGGVQLSAYTSTSSTTPNIIGDRNIPFLLKTSEAGNDNVWASDSTALSGQALLNLNSGEYITLISTYSKLYTLKNIRIEKYDYRDVNFDNTVDAADLTLLRKDLLGISSDAKITDINGDRQTDILDLVHLKKGLSSSQS